MKEKVGQSSFSQNDDLAFGTQDLWICSNKVGNYEGSNYFYNGLMSHLHFVMVTRTRGNRIWFS